MFKFLVYTREMMLHLVQGKLLLDLNNINEKQTVE